jgi:ribosomal protein RSM22 (predicted rRNA methylase)
MQLPNWLRDAIEEIAAEVPQRDLARAAVELSEAYRSGDFSRAPLDSNARRVAYLAQRLPATYATCTRVFEEISARAPDFAPKTTLDLGAGPGTATVAATGVWPTIERATLVERDLQLVEFGKRVLYLESEDRDAVARVSTSWIVADLKTIVSSDVSEGHDSSGAESSSGRASASAAEVRVSSCDLVILSYALGELSQPEQQRLIGAAWKITGQSLVIIEPGTKRGFANVLNARDLLGRLGAHIVAPCPRSGPHACPMTEANDWCHFAQRVERTALHRKLKGGELGYEDERFSYVVVSRQPLPTAESRIVRHPVIRKGHVELQLCTPSGVQRVTVGKSQKERYRAARKASWGDSFQI